MSMGRCRDCQQTVRWVITDRGAAMPIDPEPNPHGNVIIVLGAARFVDVRTSATTRARYMPHVASCPTAQQVPLPGF